MAAGEVESPSRAVGSVLNNRHAISATGARRFCNLLSVN